MARKEERNAGARRAIVREWDSWAAKNIEDAKGNPIIFFTYLQRERSDLLDFNSGGADKWQIVHGWLLSERRVKT